MGAITEIESFEQQFLQIIQELQTITASENRLREALRTESTRAEAAEAARDAALRSETEAQSCAAAANAGAAHATAAFAKVQDELAAAKMQFECAERHRVALEEKCSDMCSQIDSLQRENHKLKSLQAVNVNLQHQYNELQERVHNATSEARREASRLEAELRRVEKCASGGGEIRDRARLAAAAHIRERRLAAAELQHTTEELHKAKAEATKLSALVAELQCRQANIVSSDSKIKEYNPYVVALSEVRATLETERAGAARLERALAAALADNATLAARQHSEDNANKQPRSPQASNPAETATNICPIDSFLAE